MPLVLGPRSAPLSYFLHLQWPGPLPWLGWHECDLEHLLQRLHRMEVEYVPHFIRHVLDVGLIALRQDDGLDPSAMGAEDLLLQSTDRKNAPAQRDLTSHCNILPDWTL